MIKQVLIHITRIDIFPIISLVLFMVFFTAILIRALRLTRRHTHYMGSLPLDSNSAEQTGEIK
jgi:hypothetical protein